MEASTIPGHLELFETLVDPVSGMLSVFLGSGGFRLYLFACSLEDIRTRTDAGSFTLLAGTAAGVGPEGVFLSQSSPRIKGAAEIGDRFASALAVVDLNDDGRGDIVAGIPGEETSGGVDSGAI